MSHAETDAALEVARTVNKSGMVSLAGCYLPAAEILVGRRVAVRIEDADGLSYLG
ncbi:hypothetical protein [Planotetraspora kaengkrachanensis]|uniref:Uncharacterized protein n=1 Tax=Planotetraspora kaengkrachanensis TaxID=575193 RepID=A0A8J3PSL9_9ACTN|nr:hypothetical protein [Planotetraspora kaengkrachanensis]GIG79609.1 hypothetical protein Pka01_27360 [Planotetraspora kaengkrachanensis]